MREDASVMHLDADAFFASVEKRQRPSLARVPVIVGGVGPRGVVATASYEARAFGVHSAMSTSQARVLCPQATYLAPRFAAYAAHSAVIMDTLRRLSPLVQPVSLDEAFVDLAAGPFAADPVTAADRVRREIFNATGLVVSVGLGRSKLIAKLASDAQKPRGFTVVTADREDEFLLPLPVKALWGVGPATTATLQQLGIRTVAQLREAGVAELTRALGEAAGRNLYQLSRGLDDRPVEPDREVKSVGAEQTFLNDLARWELPGALDTVLQRAVRRLARHGGGTRTVTVKVRLADFTTLTRSVTVPQPTAEMAVLRAAAQQALAAAGVVDPVRLLGVSLSGLTDFTQLLLPDDLDAAVRAGEAGHRLRLDVGRDSNGDAASNDSPEGRDEHADTDDDSDEERLPAPLTSATCWPGVDVAHAEHGAGWVLGVDAGIVRVRFEGPTSTRWSEHTFRLDRDPLERVPPPPPTPPARPVPLPA